MSTRRAVLGVAAGFLLAFLFDPHVFMVWLALGLVVGAAALPNPKPQIERVIEEVVTVAPTPPPTPTPRAADRPSMSRGQLRSQLANEQELSIRLETYTLIDRLLSSLPTQPTLASIAEGVIDFVREKVDCQSTVLFWIKDGALLPVAMASPHPPPPMEQIIGGPVEAALRSGRPVLTQENPRLSLLFPDEPTALVVPLGDRGALYVGQRDSVPYRGEPINLVSTLAKHTLPTLRAAHFHQGQREALQSEARARAQLQALVGQLAMMLDGIAELVSVKQPEWLLGRTGQLLERLVPHRARLVQVGSHRSAGGVENNLAAQELVQVVMLGKRTLLEDAITSKLTPPARACESLLVVPLMTEDTALGAILLARPRNEPFTQQEVDVLSVLAYQVTTAFENARLFGELDEAHKALKESQAQLIQSSKMAAIGQLAGGVAHELNTPLGAVALAATSALELLHERPERAEKRLQNVVRGAAQMKEIVAKLLFYSRDARSGRVETDVNRVIGDTLQIIGSQLKIDNVELETELGQVPSVHANQSELQQVFTNLLINARDAARSASRRAVRISSRLEGERVVVAVRDWGAGVPEAVRARIFEPFFTTKEVGHGTGLGLSVTMELVTQHDGTLEVRDASGGGAEFVVSLPKG